MKKILFSLIFSSLFLVFSFKPALAGVNCTPIYGGGQTCVQVGPVVINKMVSHPKTGTFVENLGVNDDKFAPDQPISFQITISNTGQTVLSRVIVEDTLPVEVKNVAGPGALFGRLLRFEELNLNPGESRARTISGNIVSTSQLPSDKIINCEPINQVTVSVDGQPGSTDNTTFCIELPQVDAPVVTATPAPAGKGAVVPTTAPVTKGGLKVFPPPAATTTPPTGAEALALMGLIPTGILGHFLRRKTSNL